MRRKYAAYLLRRHTMQNIDIASLTTLEINDLINALVGEKRSRREEAQDGKTLPIGTQVLVAAGKCKGRRGVIVHAKPNYSVLKFEDGTQKEVYNGRFAAQAA